MRRYFLYLTSYIVPVFCVVSASSAQPVPPQGLGRDLATDVRAAKQDFAAVTTADVAQVRDELRAAVGRLNRYLGSGTRGQGWRNYLQLNDLQSQLQSASPNLEALKAARTNFAADHPGLEMPVYSDVRAALNSYIEVLEASGNAQARAHYDSQIDALATALDSYAKSPSEPLARTINEQLAALQASRQGRKLIRTIRDQYSTPNIWINVAEDIVGGGINREIVDERSKIRDVILGADVEGTAITNGRLTTQLVPNQKMAVIQTSLYGVANSDTWGYKGPASVHTLGVTTFTGRQTLTMDANGLKANAPCAEADTCSEILAVCTKKGRGLIHNIATKTAYKKLPIAEDIAGDKAEARVRQRIRDESGEQIRNANVNYREKFRDPLVRYQAWPELFRFETTDSQLKITALAGNRWQLAAPSMPPAIEGTYGATAQFHESAANNLANQILAGRTITDESVREDSLRYFGKVPKELELEPDAPHWTMTFTDRDPVIVSFVNGGFNIVLRGQGFTAGDQELQAWNIFASYKIQRDGKGMKAIRQKELDVLPAGEDPSQPRRLPTNLLNQRSVLTKRFNKVFPPEMVSEGLKLPGKWGENVGTLTLTQLASDAGWLVLGWQKESTQQASTGQATDHIGAE